MLWSQESWHGPQKHLAVELSIGQSLPWTQILLLSCHVTFQVSGLSLTGVSWHLLSLTCNTSDREVAPFPLFHKASRTSSFLTSQWEQCAVVTKSLNRRTCWDFWVVAILKTKLYIFFFFFYTLISMERALGRCSVFLFYSLKLSVALLMFTKKPVSKSESCTSQQFCFWKVI